MSRALIPVYIVLGYKFLALILTLLYLFIRTVDKMREERRQNQLWVPPPERLEDETSSNNCDMHQNEVEPIVVVDQKEGVPEWQILDNITPSSNAFDGYDETQQPLQQQYTNDNNQYYDPYSNNNNNNATVINNGYNYQNGANNYINNEDADDEYDEYSEDLIDDDVSEDVFPVDIRAESEANKIDYATSNNANNMNNTANQGSANSPVNETDATVQSP